MKILMKAFQYCKKVNKGKGSKCPKTGLWSKNPYLWWCKAFMWVRKYACMAQTIIF